MQARQTRLVTSNVSLQVRSAGCVAALDIPALHASRLTSYVFLKMKTTVLVVSSYFRRISDFTLLVPVACIYIRVGSVFGYLVYSVPCVVHPFFFFHETMLLRFCRFINFDGVHLRV